MTAAKKEDLRLLVTSGIFIGEFEQNPELVQVSLPLIRMPTMPSMKSSRPLEKRLTLY